MCQRPNQLLLFLLVVLVSASLLDAQISVPDPGEMNLVAPASACADARDDSPTGRNPRLAWTCAKQKVWDQMYADYLARPSNPSTLGGKWFEVIKSYCDAPVYTAKPPIRGIYGDFGQWNAMCYQWTGDARYITDPSTGMWAKVTRWYLTKPDASNKWASWDPNVSRIKNGMMTIMLEWAWPALDATQRSTLVQKIDSDNDHGRIVYMQNTFPWSDSDQLMGQGYLPIALMHIILPNNASNEALWNDPEMGGFAAMSATPRTTARNQIRMYFESMAAGGEWIETGEYNAETIPWTIVMMQAISDALGSDQFPEMTAWLPGFADRMIHFITPDKLKHVQWGDEENPDIWRTFTVSNALTAVEGLLQGTTKGQQVQQLILDLVAQYGTAMAPALRWWGMMVYNPYTLGSNYKTAKSYYASGEGAMTLRSGWTSSDALLFVHGAPRFPDATTGHFSVDHQVVYLGDVQLYRAGEWVLHHPFMYAGANSTGEADNVLLTNGMGSAVEYKKVRAASNADTHAFIELTTGGAMVSKTHYLPPPVAINEHTRAVLGVPGATFTTIVYDRANVDAIANTSGDLQRYFTGCANGQAGQQKSIADQHARQEFIWHIPVNPTVAGNVFTWATPITRQQVKWTSLLPSSASRTVYDLNTDFAKKLATGARCGWADSQVLDQYEVDTAPYNWKLIKIWPSTMTDFHTYLNVFQVGAAALNTATVITNNNAECAHVVTSRQNDILACFNGTPSSALNDTAYHATHAAALDSVRLRGAGTYTIPFTASASTTEFYPTHLNPAHTWVYTVDGGAPVSIAGLEITGGFARIVLSLPPGPHTLVVTGS